MGQGDQIRQHQARIGLGQAGRPGFQQNVDSFARMQSPEKQDVLARSNPGIELGRPRYGIVEKSEIDAVLNLNDPGGRLQTPQRLRCEAADGHNSVRPSESCDGAGSCSGLEDPRAAFPNISAISSTRTPPGMKSPARLSPPQATSAKRVTPG